jgi:hypothetical protein
MSSTSIFGGFKLAGYMLGNLPYTVSARKEIAYNLPSLPPRPVSKNEFMPPFPVWTVTYLFLG